MTMNYSGDYISDSDGGKLKPSSSVMRNRIINGAMVIDQRNAGASVTPTTDTYVLDRWVAGASAASKYSVQQNAGSVTPPIGFSKYLGVTSLSAYSVAAGDNLSISQYIEGFNFADLMWGTANAKTVTLSFWVYSSLTGTFGGSLNNSAVNRSYPFSYSIPVANTWTQISITIAGDTTGTWVGATNGIGARLYFGLGIGSTYQGTAGSWAGTLYLSATGATSVVGTNGATFYITGVQLEVGSSATGYEYRQYGQELALCQRYYETTAPAGVAPVNGASANARQILCAYGTGSAALAVRFIVPKRASPTIAYYGGSILGGSTWSAYVGGVWVAATSMAVGNQTTDGYEVEYVKAGTFSVTGSYISQGGWTANAEL